jgi:hypothetical protein
MEKFAYGMVSGLLDFCAGYWRCIYVTSGHFQVPSRLDFRKEIFSRVQHYIREGGRFERTSIRVLGEWRIVTLMGCVQTRDQP